MVPCPTLRVVREADPYKQNLISRKAAGPPIGAALLLYNLNSEFIIPHSYQYPARTAAA